MSLLSLSVGALALAQASLTTAFDDFESNNFADVAPAVDIMGGDDIDVALGEVSYVEAGVADDSEVFEARAIPSPYPTSFSQFPTDNSAYAAMTRSQHSQFCKTAKTTVPGYSRACIDKIWDTLYGRSVAPEDQLLEVLSTTSSLATTTFEVQHDITPAPEVTEELLKRNQGEHQYVPSAKPFRIPADEAKSKAFVASLDDKCGSSSADYKYVCSIWADQKPTLTATEAPKVKRDDPLISDLQPTAAIDVDSEDVFEHFNFNRNVYLSSLVSACPTATEPVVKAKCSAISSWYAEATATPAATTAPAMSKPTTFATVTRSRVVEADAGDVGVVEKRGRNGGAGYGGMSAGHPHEAQGQGQGQGYGQGQGQRQGQSQGQSQSQGHGYGDGQW